MGTGRRPHVPGWTAFLAIAILAVAGLLGWAGLSPIATRSFALGVPAQTPVAMLSVSQQACESPIVAPDPADSVGVYAVPVGDPGAVRVDVRSVSGGRSYGAGLVGVSAFGGVGVDLQHDIPAHVPVRVCVRSVQGEIGLLGSVAQTPGVTMTGGEGDTQFALELTDTGHSLLSVLPRTFARASLWKLSWMGSWTLWVLVGLLLGTIPLGALALGAAGRADGEEA